MHAFLPKTLQSIDTTYFTHFYKLNVNRRQEINFFTISLNELGKWFWQSPKPPKQNKTESIKTSVKKIIQKYHKCN